MPYAIVIVVTTGQTWSVANQNGQRLLTVNLKSQDAAQRIADIFNEVGVDNIVWAE
jgi:hypothetical protein